MHLYFLLPLMTGLVSGYVFQKSADEMAYLTGLVTLLSLILSIVLAPWQIQLLVLGLVIHTSKKLLLVNQHKIQNQHKREFN